MRGESGPFNKNRAEQFTKRLASDLAIALHGAMTYIGDKLGIFKAMAEAGWITLDQLACKTGLNQRYLREWLGSMVAAEYLEYDPARAAYLLPAEHTAPLANEDSRVFLGGFIQTLVPHISVAARVAQAFKSGGGVAQGEYPPEIFEAMERMSAPWYKNHLIQRWIPQMPRVKAALESGGKAVDVGCGSGRAAISIAKAFPKARVFGFDSHPASIERARANASAEGLDQRITFEVMDCSRLPAGEFDFVSTFDVVHDAVDPVGLMTAIREALHEDGHYLMLEINASDKLEENINPMGRLLYSISTLYCLTTSLAHGGAGIGTLMGEPRAREMAQQAGFSRFRRLPVDDAFSVLYELRP